MRPSAKQLAEIREKFAPGQTRVTRRGTGRTVNTSPAGAWAVRALLAEIDALTANAPPRLPSLRDVRSVRVHTEVDAEVAEGGNP